MFISVNPNNSYKAILLVLFMENYDFLIEQISKSGGLSKEEVEREVEAKRAKLSGLISKEGAAQIIAAEKGINFEDKEMKISEIMAGMKKVNVFGKVVSLFPVRTFERNGREGKVANLIIADETGNTRVVLWDTNHIELIEKGIISQGDVVEVKGGSVRDGEIHLSSFSELSKSDKVLKDVKTERVTYEKEISELQQGQSVKIRGVVVQMFAPKFFNVCPECGKKVSQDVDGFICAEHGKVSPKERAILNFVIDDGSENIRAVLFSDAINKIVNELDLKDLEKLTIFRDDFLGTEIFLSGNVRKNSFFNNMEIIASNVEKVDVEKLISYLEKGV